MVNGIVRQLESQGDARHSDRAHRRTGDGRPQGARRRRLRALRLGLSQFPRGARFQRDRRRTWRRAGSRAGGRTEARKRRAPRARRVERRARRRRALDGRRAAFGRRISASTAPNPSVGAIVVGTASSSAAASPRPAAGRTPSASRSIEAGEAARGATLYVTLEPCSHHGRDAALRRRDRRGRRRARRLRARGSRPARRRARPRAAARGGDRGRGRRRRSASAARPSRPYPARDRRPADGDARSSPDRRRLRRRRRARRAPARSPARRPTARAGDARRLHDAIMIGVGTALDDDPVADGAAAGRRPAAAARRARLAARAAAPLAPRRDRARTPDLVIATAAARPRTRGGARGTRRRGRRGSGRSGRRHVDLGAALRLLGKRGVTRVFSEGGPRVASRLIALGLADEVVVFTALKPLGRPGLPALDAAAHAALADPAR